MTRTRIGPSPEGRSSQDRNVYVLLTGISPISTDTTGAFVFPDVPGGDYAISPLTSGSFLPETCRYSVKDADGMPVRVTVNLP